jgi:hypothetical protein
MADAAIDVLRAELIAAEAVLGPQIVGLHAYVVLPFTPELLEKLNDQITIRERRSALEQAVLDAMQALEADGYPSLDNFSLTPALHAQLQAELNALEAAASIFSVTPPIASASSDFLDADHTTQPVPPKLS